VFCVSTIAECLLYEHIGDGSAPTTVPEQESPQTNAPTSQPSPGTEREYTDDAPGRLRRLFDEENDELASTGEQNTPVDATRSTPNIEPTTSLNDGSPSAIPTPDNVSTPNPPQSLKFKIVRAKK
jgi:hypothetical protein